MYFSHSRGATIETCKGWRSVGTVVGADCGGKRVALIDLGI